MLIIGAGPAGLATAACLSQRSIPYLIVEREDCSASLWHYRTYNRVKLHLSKEFSSLPYMPHPDGTPTYIPKEEFLKYLDCYAEHFDIKPRYCTCVVSAAYEPDAGLSLHVTRLRAQKSCMQPSSWSWPPVRMERGGSRRSWV